MMFLLRPASLRQLVLTSFAIALIPLAVLLWQGHAALTRINDLAVREAQDAVRNARHIENMDNLVIDIERAIRQYDVVRSESTRQVAENNLKNYTNDLQTICFGEGLTETPAVCHLQQQHLRILSNTFATAESEELNIMLRDLRSQQRQLTHLIWQQLNERLAQQQDYVNDQQRWLTWQTIGLVLLTLLLVAWSSGRISTPIKRLDRMIRTIGQQDSGPLPADVGGPRELNELGDRLRWLSARLQQLEALRLALLRHASHELKTPLASMKEGCSLLSEGIAGPLNHRQREVLALLCGSTERLAQLTEQLLDYNQLLQQSEVSLEQIDPCELIDTTVEQHALALRQREQEVEVQCELAELWTDSKLFQRILDNLLNNAQAYGRQAGRILIRLVRVKNQIHLEVANTGPTIPHDQRQTLFEPFQRGQTPRMDSLQGSGLGLSVVADCARMLEGQAKIIDIPDYDVCVRIELPVKGVTA